MGRVGRLYAAVLSSATVREQHPRPQHRGVAMQVLSRDPTLEPATDTETQDWFRANLLSSSLSEYMHVKPNPRLACLFNIRAMKPPCLIQPMPASACAVRGLRLILPRSVSVKPLPPVEPRRPCSVSSPAAKATGNDACGRGFSVLVQISGAGIQSDSVMRQA